MDTRLLCVTDRHACERPFLEQLRRVADARPAGILLREKDLAPEAYRELAGQAAAICRDAGILFIVHTHVDIAHELGCHHLHATLPTLQGMPSEKLRDLSAEFELSTSCHSVEDALHAQELGCARILAGHVYETDCKPGLEPRGLKFLREVCASVDIPVWAIGGVTPERLPELQAAGASGGCMRGPFMRL